MTITVDDKGFRELLAGVQAIASQSVAKSLQVAAGIMARTMGHLTWPKAYEDGYFATRSQIGRPYATIGRVYKDMKLHCNNDMAGGYYMHMKNGRPAKAIRILRGSNLAYKGIPYGAFDKSYHERSRDRRGRVTLKAPIYALIDSASKTLERYRLKKIKNVGLTQSGWYKCLRLLGTKNVTKKSKFSAFYPEVAEGTTMKPFPSWVVNGHKKADNGAIRFNLTGPKMFIEIHNKTPWAKEALHAGAEEFVKNAGRQRVINYLKSTIHYALMPRNRKK